MRSRISQPALAPSERALNIRSRTGVAPPQRIGQNSLLAKRSPNGHRNELYGVEYYHNGVAPVKLRDLQSKATRETKTDVKRLVINPITSVAANPFTAGVPKKNRKPQETTVVTCVSTRVAKALENPAASAAATDFPARSSSRMRSKMSTLLSTAMPIVSTAPAIPGNVSTAPKHDRAAIS